MLAAFKRWLRLRRARQAEERLAKLRQRIARLSAEVAVIESQDAMSRMFHAETHQRVRGELAAHCEELRQLTGTSDFTSQAHAARFNRN